MFRNRSNTQRGKNDSITVISIVSAVLLLIPVIVLLWYGLGVYHKFSVLGSTLEKAIELTLVASAMSAGITFIVFTPLSYELARRKHRILDMISDIPASIPHPVVGIAILILGSPVTPVGSFLNSIGINFFDSILGMTIALSFVSAPIYIRAAQSLFRAAPVDQEIYAKTLGISRLRILYSILLPGEAGGFLSASLTSMSRAMSEFGSIAIVSYYIVGGYFNGVRPSSVLIYEYYGYAGPGVAVTAAAILIAVSMIILVAIKLIPLSKLREEYRI